MQNPIAHDPKIAGPARAKCERIANRISTLCSYVYAAEHRLLTLIRDFDEQEGWKYLGFPGCAHWLNFHCGMDMNTAPRITSRHWSGSIVGPCGCRMPERRSSDTTTAL
jgi:hypothetical protein